MAKNIENRKQHLLSVEDHRKSFIDSLKKGVSDKARKGLSVEEISHLMHDKAQASIEHDEPIDKQ